MLVNIWSLRTYKGSICACPRPRVDDPISDVATDGGSTAMWPIYLAGRQLGRSRHSLLEDALDRIHGRLRHLGYTRLRQAGFTVDVDALSRHGIDHSGSPRGGGSSCDRWETHQGAVAGTTPEF